MSDADWVAVFNIAAGVLDNDSFTLDQQHQICNAVVAAIEEYHKRKQTDGE